MVSRAVLILSILAACEYEDTLQKAYGYPPVPFNSTGTGTLTDAATATAATEVMTGGGASESTATSTGEPSTTTGGPATGEDAGSTGDPIRPPELLAVDMPQKVTVAGPVEVVVLAQQADTVRGVLDGGQTFSFDKHGDDGDDVDTFTTVIPMFGSIDDGPHLFEVIAERDGLEDSLTRPFEVASPAAGVIAWERYGGPGSRTHRLAFDFEGLLEGGALEIGGVERPAVRKRDPVTAGDLWPAGWITLDNREGAIADLAATPEGRLWVAMNVREGDTWRARIALFEPDMQPTGIELEKPGATVTAIESDSDGGCFAGGYATTIHNDADVLMFRIASDGTPIASGHPWDFPSQQAHKFNDLAFDVVVDSEAGEAWIVGASQGKHAGANGPTQARGLILRVDLDTLEVLTPVIVAPPFANLTQSTFHGAALDPNGILVTGLQCDHTCVSQQFVAYRYGVGGVGTLIASGNLTSVAFGSSIARNAHGAVLIAVNVKDGLTMRGSLLGLRDGMETFAPLVFPGKGATDASAVVVGPYDWAFVAGQATVDGAAQAYVMRPHQ